MDHIELVERVLCLFLAHGQERHDYAQQQGVSALAHALQCAQLAEWARAEPPLVAAALLHDIGHFLDGTPQPRYVDDAHERIAAAFLSRALGPAVVEPVRLHVQAKRYLVTTDSRYASTLSPASAHSLALQGGAMSAAECRAFEALPFAEDALRLRRWDDAAQDPARRTPPLDYYLELLTEVAAPPARIALGALDVS